ncbi:MmcQ/YjbR family DNA-binding protein [Streptomyces sp. NPDC127108]|uniref:MmcQ/YjbR family DNA-binding protein n=1 Tax=Streptomyces sp. NPDC127108 TaxID=3345361 RepID=UPI0036416FA6
MTRQRIPADDEVPLDVLTHLRTVCLSLPDAHEEPAWIGTRWRIRTATFAHVYLTDWTRSHSPSARAIATEGLTTTLTFRSTGEEFEALTNAGAPFFRLSWGRNVVGMRLDEATDWAEVAELLTESYRVQAPKRLAARVGPPPATGSPGENGGDPSDRRRGERSSR